MTEPKDERIRLSQRRLRHLFNYDPDTGIFTRRVRIRRVPAGQQPHKDSSGYLKFMISGKSFLVHRLIWKWVYGEWPAHQIDHIDGDGTNNRLSNLRTVSASENCRNQRLPRHNTSGAIGVHKNCNTGRWQAYIRANGRIKHLGHFESKQDAILARRRAEINYNYHENHGRKD